MRSFWPLQSIALLRRSISLCEVIARMGLPAAANGIEQKRSLAKFFDWYNLRRSHQTLGWRTPNEAYLGQSMASTALAA
jgi:hypothetical protein